jgi:hypothetical protein
VSFLVDPPWLFANGEAYARLAPTSAQGGRAAVAAAGTLAAFLGVGVSLYANARWTRAAWPLLPGRDGRDFMVNFPGLRVDTRRAGRGLDAVAAVVFAAYPLALWAGWAHGRRAQRGAAA